VQARIATKAPPADYRTIVAGLRSSDQDVAGKSLTDLICYLQPKLAAWLRQQGVRDDNDIRDILQTTWQKVWQSRADVDPSRFCQAWVFRICLHNLVDAGRERSKRHEVCLTDTYRDSLTTDAAEEQLEPCASQSGKRRVLQEAVLAEISRWSEADQRIIWTWVNADGDDWTEHLSLATGKKPSTLRKRLFDLKDRLRKVAALLDGCDRVAC
jgi:DNA-directed RNA polymerase specialized sigma24 family protein